MVDETQQAQELRQIIFRKLLSFGYVYQSNGELKPPDSTDKNSIRVFHEDRHRHVLQSNKEWIIKHEEKVFNYFANGDDIDISSISPKLINVQDIQRNQDLFRYATYLWSIPVSQGYGRRMRYLVMDSSNNKLIGIIGLTDPVIGLKARDDWIGWTRNQKEDRLWHTLDSYVLGAVPPYNLLLGGKIVAALLTSNEIRNDFKKKYENKKAVISGKRRKGHLALVTTNTALGKSSMLSRLYYTPGGYNEKTDAKNRRELWHHVGWTSGYGHFHLNSGLADEMIDYLQEVGDPIIVKHRFGQGPHWKMRVIRNCLQRINLNGNNLLYHGIKRGFYGAPLTPNFKEYLCGKTNELEYYDQTAEDISTYIKDRYIIPRAKRVLDQWECFNAENIRVSKGFEI
ncbi:MAG: Druantia anti-phage system protein DruA [Candidatus Methanoperedens sp.]